jgi:hypothetical protein
MGDEELIEDVRMELFTFDDGMVSDKDCAKQIIKCVRENDKKEEGKATKGMYYCDKHGGYGFMSDCVDCVDKK